jgi:putative pyruvate formate lyase activating enzyme
MTHQITVCTSCPRRCAVDRTAGQLGVCGAPEAFRVARIAPHMWEEPPISGTRGSGTVFFSGCSLRCVFCQNRAISREGRGETLTDDALADRILRLQQTGVHNINLVTPTHYARRLRPFLEKLRPHLRVPVVYNCGGYEDVNTLRELEGLIDIYLPDFKYISPELSRDYSGAANYAEVAAASLSEMFRQVGGVTVDGEGMMTRGMIVRHLVLPGCRHDSMAVLRRLHQLLPTDQIRLSLMAQYTPEFAADCPYPNLHRRLTRFEYSSVLSLAEELGFDGYMQSPESVGAKYTPEF